MLTPDQIRDHLQDRNLQKVADGSHLSYSTIRAFMREGANPSFETVKKLNIYLEAPWSSADK